MTTLTGGTKRPNLQDYYPNIVIQSEEMIAAPKLLAYAKALEQYVKHLEEYKNEFPSPQEVTDEEIYSESKKLGDFAMEAGFSAGAKWMRSKLNK